MAQQRRGLGKGLGALIPESPQRPDPAADGSAGTQERTGRVGSVGHRPGAGGAAGGGSVGGLGGGGRGNGGRTGAGYGAGATGGGNGTATQDEAGYADGGYGGDRYGDGGHSDPRFGRAGYGEDAELLTEVPGAHYAEISVTAISPNPRQPRRTFDEDSLDELAESIREVGLLQPVVVRLASPGNYELIMGERRWRASQRAGLTEIAAIVRETADTDLLRDALIENLHRQQLDPLEEAAAYQQLLDDFGATHEQLAQKIGRSRPHISNTLRLLNLPPAVQKRVAAGVLTAGHARALLGLDDVSSQERLAQRIVAEGLSVRAVEEIVAIGNDDGKRKQRAARPPKSPTAPGLKHLSDRLSDIFETRVKVELGRHKGKIVVEFASLDDLERIVNAMAPKTPVGTADGDDDAASDGGAVGSPGSPDATTAQLDETAD